MSFLGAGNTSDAEQEKSGLSDYRMNRSNNNLSSKPITSKFSDNLWNNKDDSDSEISDSGHFLAKGNVVKKSVFKVIEKNKKMI